MTESLPDLRIRYDKDSLTRKHLADDPFDLLETWLGVALAAEVDEPNAMSLATVSPEGRPTARTVLLKGVEAESGTILFYTSHLSRKAGDIDANPEVAVNLHWKELERQVGITGTAEKLDRATVEAYFHSRPYESRIGAWVSEQSRPIPDRAWLEHRVAELTEEYPENGVVPCPEFWGGYRIRARTVEFWQGRPGRLHDRFLYEKCEDGGGDGWTITRLSP